MQSTRRIWFAGILLLGLVWVDTAYNVNIHLGSWHEKIRLSHLCVTHVDRMRHARADRDCHADRLAHALSPPLHRNPAPPHRNRHRDGDQTCHRDAGIHCDGSLRPH